ncbi:MAG: ribokinase [Cellulosilyticum sp.]|nr:ribokinase [Cellulosilyticum sp.]
MRILNYGSLNLDYVYDVNHFVQAGETLASTGMEIFCGGKGFNQSLAICKSGQEVWHAGAIGESDGDRLVENLLQEGVHINLISKKEGSTGHAIIQKDLNGQNCILLYGGANQKLTKEDIDLIIKQFDKGDYLILQNEVSHVGYMMQKAYEKGMQIVFNPSPMNEQIKTYPLKYVSYLILNEIEAKQISEMNANELKEANNMGIGCARVREAIKGIENINQEIVEQVLNGLVSYLPQVKIILTLGDKGSIYVDEDTAIFQKAYKVKVVDTTAAGDTFTGFFIGALAQGKEIKEAMVLASKAAALSVTKKGAGVSIPALEEVLNN